MVTRAVMRYVRISPRKFRLIVPMIKGKNPEDAIIILRSVKKGATQYAIDLLKSVIANAKRIQGVDVANLYISRLTVDGGPQLKRFRAASMGRASAIRKRTSHITIELDTVPTPEGSATTKVAENARSKSPSATQPQQKSAAGAKTAKPRQKSVKAKADKKVKE